MDEKQTAQPFPKTNRRTWAEVKAESARLIDAWIRDRHQHPVQGGH